jgi:AAA family ATP:ADP antiporter
MKRVIAGAINAKPHELGGALAAFLCAFAMFSSYSILRPIRETMGLTSGLETLPALFWGTFVGMLLMQPVYVLTSRYPRTVSLPWSTCSSS